MNTLIKTDNKLISVLSKIVGSANVLSEYEERYCFSFDATSATEQTGVADVVVFVETKEQVSEILKYANKNKISVIARCAGTNHVGACIPKQGGIVISFSKMDKILEINKNNLTCKVQPGVVVKTLQDAVGAVGLFYPPDPSNLEISMIGGSIALSSGGPKAFKYGTTKDYIIDLEIVLADGSIMRTGSSCAKNVTGYNLTQLFVGSEGTLGIITEATIRLIPKPKAKKVLLVYFDDMNDALKSVNDVISSLIAPSVIDLMDKNTLTTIENYNPSGLLADKEAALLVEVDGFEKDLEQQYKEIQDICKINNSIAIKTAVNALEQENIWKSRRNAYAAMATLAPAIVSEDVVVPRENIIKLIQGIKEICKKYSLKVCIFGHIGDGNVHPNIAFDPRNEIEMLNYKAAKNELTDLVLSLGGTLSGEHGIGCEKAQYMSKALSKEAIQYMKQIKKLFDPNNILNPGKIFQVGLPVKRT